MGGRWYKPYVGRGHAHLDATMDAAAAAGMSYGDYVAMITHLVTVSVPKHLREAPTMFERLNGAVPARPLKRNFTPPAAENPAEANIRTDRVITEPPTRPEFTLAESYANRDFVPAPWLEGKRRTAGLRKATMSRLCGVDKNTYIRWERDARLPKALTQYVSDLLDYHINYGDAEIITDE